MTAPCWPATFARALRAGFGQARREELATRIKALQFRDIRPKAASEINNLDDASSFLGHTDKGITKRVYRRTGELVKPTK